LERLEPASVLLSGGTIGTFGTDISIRHVSRLGCVQDQPKQGDRGKTKSDPSYYRLSLALDPQSSLVLGQASSDDQHQ
jgi:hypothetical protein